MRAAPALNAQRPTSNSESILRSVFETGFSRRRNATHASARSSFVVSSGSFATYRMGRLVARRLPMDIIMKNPTLYDMARQLEDKRNTLVETLVYGSLLVSVVVSIMYAAVQPVIVPDGTVTKTAETEYRA